MNFIEVLERERGRKKHSRRRGRGRPSYGTYSMVRVPSPRRENGDCRHRNQERVPIERVDNLVYEQNAADRARFTSNRGRSGCFGSNSTERAAKSSFVRKRGLRLKERAGYEQRFKPPTRTRIQRRYSDGGTLISTAKGRK